MASLDPCLQLGGLVPGARHYSSSSFGPSLRRSLSLNRRRSTVRCEERVNQGVVVQGIGPGPVKDSGPVPDISGYGENLGHLLLGRAKLAKTKSARSATLTLGRRMTS